MEENNMSQEEQVSSTAENISPNAETPTEETGRITQNGNTQEEPQATEPLFDPFQFEPTKAIFTPDAYMMASLYHGETQAPNASTMQENVNAEPQNNAQPGTQGQEYRPPVQPVTPPMGYQQTGYVPYGTQQSPYTPPVNPTTPQSVNPTSPRPACGIGDGRYPDPVNPPPQYRRNPSPNGVPTQQPYGAQGVTPPVEQVPQTGNNPVSPQPAPQPNTNGNMPYNGNTPPQNQMPQGGMYGAPTQQFYGYGMQPPPPPYYGPGDGRYPNPMAVPPQQAPEHNTKALISMILGILSCVLTFLTCGTLFPLGVPVAVAGLILAILSKNAISKRMNGQAKTGLITSIVSLAFVALLTVGFLMIFFIVGLTEGTSNPGTSVDEYYEIVSLISRFFR